MERLSNIFWGLLLVFFGILSLMENFELLSVDWWHLIRLWPALIVYFGLLFLPEKMKIIGIFSLLFLIGGFTFYHLEWVNSNSSTSSSIEDQTEQENSITQSSDLMLPYDSSYKVGRLNVEGGPGKFQVNGSTKKMAILSGHQEVGWEALHLNHEQNEDTFTINAQLSKGDFPESGTKPIVFLLNPRPIWLMTFEIGASKADFDLSPFKIKSLNIKAGASNLDLKLGDKLKNTQVTLETDASAITLQIPEKTGCKIQSDADLSNLNLEGFNKLKDETWITPEFEKADSRISIKLEAGLSQLKVRRYQ